MEYVSLHGVRFTPLRTDADCASIEYTYHFIREQRHVYSAVDALVREPVLAIDTETSGLSPTAADLLLVQVGTRHTAYIFDVCRLDLEPLRTLFESQDTLKLLQNAQFDRGFIRHHLKIELAPYADTRSLEAIQQSKPTNLAHLAQKYANIQLDKSIRPGFIAKAVGEEFGAEELCYSALDAIVLHEIFEKQLGQIKLRIDNRTISDPAALTAVEDLIGRYCT